MSLKKQEEVLREWDIAHNPDELEKAKEDFLKERIEAYLIVNGDRIDMNVGLPSNRKMSYIFLTNIVRALANASNESVDNVLIELKTMLDSDDLDPNLYKL